MRNGRRGAVGSGVSEFTKSLAPLWDRADDPCSSILTLLWKSGLHLPDRPKTTKFAKNLDTELMFVLY
jgi:hypothetical protein